MEQLINNILAQGWDIKFAENSGFIYAGIIKGDIAHVECGETPLEALRKAWSWQYLYDKAEIERIEA